MTTLSKFFRVDIERYLLKLFNNDFNSVSFIVFMMFNN